MTQKGGWWLVHEAHDHTIRTISNLSVVSKLLERVILRRLLEHLKRNDMLPSVHGVSLPQMSLNGVRDGKSVLRHPDCT